MKYQQGKIKREHGVMKEFEGLLGRMSDIKQVKRIIPGRIHNSSGSSSHKGISFSYTTHSGLKFKLNNGGTSQECFVICDATDAKDIVRKVEMLG